MTIVLLIQASLFADGGITTLGANIFNMAVIGGLSFYIVKLLSGSSSSQKRFTAALFIASWLSVVLTALLTAIQIGVSPSFASAGGLMTTVPAMLSVHIIIGAIEAAITAPLILQLSQASPTLLNGLNIIRGVNNEPHH
jgi:cobalt/nickel transport system permease protein